MIITKDSHPALFAALRAIDYDSGDHGLYSSETKTYTLPIPLDVCDTMNAEMARLDTNPGKDGFSELEEFSYGDEKRMDELSEKYSIPPAVSIFLNAYFEEILDDGNSYGVCAICDQPFTFDNKPRVFLNFEFVEVKAHEQCGHSTGYAERIR